MAVPIDSQPLATLSLGGVALLVLCWRRPFNEHKETRMAIVMKASQFATMFLIVVAPRLGMGPNAISAAVMLVSQLTMFYAIAMQVRPRERPFHLKACP